MPFTREGLHNNSIGSYSQILNADKTSISPGDTIKIKEYISGYGKIEGSKIMFSPSAEIIDNSNGQSYLLHGVNYYPFEEMTDMTKDAWAKALGLSKNDLTADTFKQRGIALTTWGARKEFLHNHSLVMSINGGITMDANKMPETFYDSDSGKKKYTPRIITEMIQNEKAPFLWNLTTSKKAKPGNYKFSFIFTYHNGTKYVTDNKSIDIKILHWYEKNEKLYKYIAILTAAFSIFSGSLKVYDRYFKDDSKVPNQSELYIIQKSNEIENKIDTLTKRINIINKDSI